MRRAARIAAWALASLLLIVVVLLVAGVSLVHDDAGLSAAGEVRSW